MSLHEESTGGLPELEHDELKTANQRSAMGSKIVQKIAMDRSNSPPDFLVLYLSLVRDGALPGGYDREFLSLELVVKAATRRENNKAVEITNTSAAIWLDNYEKTKALNLEEQFVLACAPEPRRFQSRLQKILYAGAFGTEGCRGIRTPTLDIDAGRATEMNIYVYGSAYPTNLRETENPRGWSKSIDFAVT